MKCDDIFEDLLILADGELDDSKRMLVEKHLKDCPVCAARLAKLQAMDGCLRGSLSLFETAPDITDIVMSEINTRQGRPVHRFAWAFAAGFVAAAACLVMLILGKPDSAKPAQEKPQIVKQTPNPKTAPVPFVQPKEEQKNIRTEIAYEQKSKKITHRKPSSKKVAQFDHTEHSLKNEVQAEASPDFSVRVELNIAGDTNSIVVSTGPIEQVIKTEPRNRVTALPANPEASSIERPPLQTVVSADPIALLIPEI